MIDGIKNAKITKADLVIERGFILDCQIMLDYGGCGQGFGGYMLAHSDKSEPTLAGAYLCKVMGVAGVDKFSQLVGKCVRVDVNGGKIMGLGHIIEDRWFFPKKLWASESKGAET